MVDHTPKAVLLRPEPTPDAYEVVVRSTGDAALVKTLVEARAIIDRRLAHGVYDVIINELYYKGKA